LGDAALDVHAVAHGAPGPAGGEPAAPVAAEAQSLPPPERGLVKAGALDFMKASTEFSAAGTWQDPQSVSDDRRADNVIIEVDYGEIKGELIGQGIVRCPGLINNLEGNEQVLYARMIDIEQSTLIE